MDSNEIDDEFSQQKNKIEELERQLDEAKFISKSTKEYLFVLEGEITAKNNQITSLKNDLKKKNKQIKSLKKKYKKVKKENDSIKSSTSWKITGPLRKIMNIFRK